MWCTHPFHRQGLSRGFHLVKGDDNVGEQFLPNKENQMYRLLLLKKRHVKLSSLKCRCSLPVVNRKFFYFVALFCRNYAHHVVREKWTAPSSGHRRRAIRCLGSGDSFLPSSLPLAWRNKYQVSRQKRQFLTEDPSVYFLILLKNFYIFFPVCSCH
jgi:hypothetical protein